MKGKRMKQLLAHHGVFILNVIHLDHGVGGTTYIYDEIENKEQKHPTSNIISIPIDQMLIVERTEPSILC